MEVEVLTDETEFLQHDEEDVGDLQRWDEVDDRRRNCSHVS
jgi:hypothetical protein